MFIILRSRHSDVCCLNSVRKNSTIELKLVKVKTFLTFCLFFGEHLKGCMEKSPK